MRLIPDLPDTLRKPLETVTYSSCIHFIFALKETAAARGMVRGDLLAQRGLHPAGFRRRRRQVALFRSPGARPGALPHLGQARAQGLNELPLDELKQMMIKDLQKIVPTMPDEPYITEVVRWDEAICLDPPGQARAIHNMRKNNYRDVEGLYLAGEYMYLISCVEGALRSGIEAAAAAAS